LTIHLNVIGHIFQAQYAHSAVAAGKPIEYRLYLTGAYQKIFSASGTYAKVVSLQGLYAQTPAKGTYGLTINLQGLYAKTTNLTGKADEE